MRSAGQDRKIVLGGGGGRVQAQLAQFDPRVGSDSMGFRRNLDLRLQELPLDTARGAYIRGLKQRVGSFRRYLECRGVGQEIFFLDAELELIVGREAVRLTPRREKCPDKKPSFLGVEAKFHSVRSFGFSDLHRLDTLGLQPALQNSDSPHISSYP